jgi:hypothetical protein
MKWRIAWVVLIAVPGLLGEMVAVRHVEGRIHGFLVLRDMEDRILASGESIQLVNGSRVTNELILHFKDGSLHQETTVFSQRRAFQLVSYHLVQKGKAFKRSTDMKVNASTGEVTVHSKDENGKETDASEHMKLPADIANGIVPTVLGDIDAKAPKTTLSMVVATPKPRLVKLEISPLGEVPFSVSGSTIKAIKYEVKVDIGGLSGAIAPLIGKQPPEVYVWMVGGKAPGFLRSDGPLFEGGPIWRIELASPQWPKASM